MRIVKCTTIHTILLILCFRMILGVGILFPKVPGIGAETGGGKVGLVNSLYIARINEFIAEYQPDLGKDMKNSTYLASLFHFNANSSLSYLSNCLSFVVQQVLELSNSLYTISVKEIRKSFDDFSLFEDSLRDQFLLPQSLRFTAPDWEIGNSTLRKSPLKGDSHPSLSRYDQIIENEKNLVLKYLSLDPVEHWEYYGHEEDIIVYRLKKSVKSDHRDDTEADKWPCVKSFTVIDLPTEKLGDLLFDSNKVVEYNRYSAGRIDLEIVSPVTKIVWNRSKPPLSTMKPYDFCTLMHLYRLPLISSMSRHPCIIILSTAVTHEKAPPHSHYSRSEIFFGVNILTPNKDDASKTDLTSISHVKYAGIHPFLAWKSGSQGTIQFLKSLKSFAEKYR